MSSVAKTVSKKLDWSKIVSSLGLTGTTASELTAFKKRYEEAQKLKHSLKEQKIDFNHYKNLLKNSKIVDEIEKKVNNFTPTTYDISKTLKSIDIFESKAIENAKLTEKSVISEIKQLESTLNDIKNSRPFSELTVDDVASARPDLDEKVLYMVKNGKYEVPSYKEKFGDLTVM